MTLAAEPGPAWLEAVAATINILFALNLLGVLIGGVYFTASPRNGSRSRISSLSHLLCNPPEQMARLFLGAHTVMLLLGVAATAVWASHLFPAPRYGLLLIPTTLLSAMGLLVWRRLVSDLHNTPSVLHLNEEEHDERGDRGA